MTNPRTSSSLLEQELLEQGAALRRRNGSAEQTDAAAELIKAGSIDYLLIAARGSSDNAARFGQYAFGAEARLSVGLAAPSLFRDPADAPDLRGAAVIGISQSGRSPDIVGVLAAGRDQKRPTIALTNDEHSPLAAVADVVVPLATGPERSVAATKTYLASLHALMQIIDGLHRDSTRRKWLDRLPELVEETIVGQLAERSEFDPLDGVSLITTVGRGLDLSTAQETALKIRELSGTVTEGFSSADLLHGPIAALDRGGALWVVDTHDRPDPTTAAVLERCRRLEMRTIVVSRSPGPPDGAGDLEIALPPDVPHWVAAILAVLPGQVAALQLADRRGRDIDHPDGLTKITLTE